MPDENQEFIYEFESHSPPWTVADNIRAEVIELGGEVIATRNISWQHCGVTVAFSDRTKLEAFIRQYYKDEEADFVETEVNSIRAS